MTQKAAVAWPAWEHWSVNGPGLDGVNSVRQAPVRVQ